MWRLSIPRVAKIALAILLMQFGDDFGQDLHNPWTWQYWLGMLVWGAGLLVLVRTAFRAGLTYTNRGGTD